MTQKEHDCELHCQKHFTKNKDGRFSVALPFKGDTVQLSDSKDIAFKGFSHLETKFNKNLRFKNTICRIFTEI